MGLSGVGGSKPTILFINRVFPPDHGATGRMVRDLALAFAKDGWSVSVLCASSTHGVERHKNADIHVHRVKAPLKSKTAWRYLKIWGRLCRAALKLPRHDVVVSMTDPPLIVVGAAWLARRKGSRHIHWCQDLYPDLVPVLGLKIPRWIYQIMYRMSRKAMQSCDKIVVIGRDMGKLLMDSGIEGNKISVIPNWTNLELLRPVDKNTGSEKQITAKQTQKQEQRSSFPADLHPLKNGQEPIINLFKDQNNPRFRILYAGSIGKAHPMETILNAAQILNSSNPEIEFVFVGDGPGFEDLARQRALRDLQNIRLIPFQPPHNLRELMESGDVHIISMAHESTGMLVPCKLYSALATGRPTILVGPDDSEIAKVLHGFKAGEIIAQGNMQELVETIKKYRYDSDLWFSAREGALQAGQIFLPRESMHAWLKRSRNLLGKPPSRNAQARSSEKAAA